MRIRPAVSHQCVRGGEGDGGGGAAMKKMTIMDTRSMETGSMGMSSSGGQRRGMVRRVWRLTWRVISGRWWGARCCGGGLVGDRGVLVRAVTFPLFLVVNAKNGNSEG